jgi:hypothetical protein
MGQEVGPEETTSTNSDQAQPAFADIVPNGAGPDSTPGPKA